MSLHCTVPAKQFCLSAWLVLLSTQTPQKLAKYSQHVEAYLIPTWLMQEQRLAQVKLTQPTNQSISQCLQVKQLVEGADAIGAVLVNRHQGFLPNKRQLRMGGLAALEMAQTLRQLVGYLACWLSMREHSPVHCHSETLPICIGGIYLRVYTGLQPVKRRVSICECMGSTERFRL